MNSVSGLLGNLSSTRRFPVFAIALAVAAIIGGTAGSYYGSRRFDHALIKRLLAVVLLIAGMKLDPDEIKKRRPARGRTAC